LRNDLTSQLISEKKKIIEKTEQKCGRKKNDFYSKFNFISSARCDDAGLTYMHADIYAL